MGAEGEDGLAGEIEPFQKGKDAHGHGAPVVGVAQVDGVVGVQRLRAGLQGGAGVPPLVILGLLDAFVVVVGVGLHGLQLEEVGPCEGLEPPGHRFGVAHRQGLDGAADVVFPPAGVVDDELCHTWPPSYGGDPLDAPILPPPPLTGKNGFCTMVITKS